MSAPARRVEVVTTIRAPRERVFDAWLTPERMARFLCAGNTRVDVIDVDPRVGGAFRIVMADDRGACEHRGRYVEIRRPERLQFTWSSAATGGADTDVTITFEPVPEGTKVTLVHLGLPDETTAQRHEGGWRSILAKCGGALDA